MKSLFVWVLSFLLVGFGHSAFGQASEQLRQFMVKSNNGKEGVMDINHQVINAPGFRTRMSVEAKSVVIFQLEAGAENEKAALKLLSKFGQVGPISFQQYNELFLESEAERLSALTRAEFDRTMLKGTNFPFRESGGLSQAELENYRAAIRVWAKANEGLYFQYINS